MAQFRNAFDNGKRMTVWPLWLGKSMPGDANTLAEPGVVVEIKAGRV